eukprot:gene9559-9635_t
MRTDSARPVRLKDYRPSDYLIDTVALDVVLDDHATRVVARLHMRPNPKGLANAPLHLDGDGLNLISLKLDGEACSHALVTPDLLTLETPPQHAFLLEIETRIDPKANTQLMGLYRSGSAFCTQCEAEGFRRITYFLDRPDVLSVYTTRIEADKASASVLLGNGNLVEIGELDGGRHFAIWHDPFPKPCYLFALVGGNLGAIFDDFVTASGRKVKLGIYVEPGKEPRATYAMDALKRSMIWDERVFGREYDLDIFNIVAVSDFNMGAMENKGLNVFNDKFVLASSETATDMDFAHIEAVIAHEYFHNWTGNRITCRDWFQLCLKEGLTVFRDQEFSSDERSRAVKRIADVKNLRATQFVEDAGPLSHNVRPESYMEINNFYTSTIYEKGAEVIRMLKTLIGDLAFSAGMTLYFDRFDGTAATMEDFISCFAVASGRNLSQFMRWYGQAGTPRVTISTAYDAQAQTFTVNLSQKTLPTPGQQIKLPFVIPVRLGLIDANGEIEDLHAVSASPEELASKIFELTQDSRTLTFTQIKDLPALSAFRGFSAPVRVEFAQSDTDLLNLAQRDTDAFNRWQALQTCTSRLLIRAATEGATLEHEGLIAAFAKVIETAGLAQADHAFAALALNLPSEADLGRDIGTNVDPDAIRTARETLKAAISNRLSAPLFQLYSQIAQPITFMPDAQGAGRRALKAVVLDLIVAGRLPTALSVAKTSYTDADNMTDRLAALAALVQVAGNDREEALNDFYKRYNREPLVIDKWFSIQATIAENTTLTRVKELMQHEAFSFGNPNRIRALIGAFALSNTTQFNNIDGSGYQFMAEIVLKLDQRNPQVAARLLSAFRSWRSFEPMRQKHAQAALQLIAASAQLSADVRDIVTRSLGQNDSLS